MPKSGLTSQKAYLHTIQDMSHGTGYTNRFIVVSSLTNINLWSFIMTSVSMTLVFLSTIIYTVDIMLYTICSNT